MKSATIYTLVALFVLIFPAVNFTTNTIPGLEFRKADAGPLSRRLESKHSPASDAQSKMEGVQSEMQNTGTEIQGGDSEAKNKCIEMLNKGDNEGAQKCIEQLQNGDSRGTQDPADNTQGAFQSSQPTDAPANVQDGNSVMQEKNLDTREKCIDMRRSGDIEGARKCFQQLRH